MSEPDPNWTGLLQRVVDGDALAFVQASRLVNSFLVRWNAYVFRDEWDDLVQEVIAAGGARAARRAPARSAGGDRLPEEHRALQVRGPGPDSASRGQRRELPLGSHRRGLRAPARGAARSRGPRGPARAARPRDRCF